MRPLKAKMAAILIWMIIFIGVSLPVVQAWDNCPFGFEDEEYPGSCWRYTDTNDDGICDLSQENPEGTTSGVTDNKSNSTPGFDIGLLVVAVIVALALMGKNLLRRSI
jgi:hypothetical protein